MQDTFSKQLIVKITQKQLDPTATIAVQHCLQEFLDRLTGIARTQVGRQSKKTITAQEVLGSIQKMEMDQALAPLKVMVERYVERERIKRQDYRKRKKDQKDPIVSEPVVKQPTIHLKLGPPKPATQMVDPLLGPAQSEERQSYASVVTHGIPQSSGLGHHPPSQIAPIQQSVTSLPVSAHMPAHSTAAPVGMHLPVQPNRNTVEPSPSAPSVDAQAFNTPGTMTEDASVQDSTLDQKVDSVQMDVDQSDIQDSAQSNVE
ncbi:hypothetical protein EDD86DRAFT_211540 [Gorgonomyces haynaldii]|nr:hypothetical protein EDD86DRAFT_211540 [Gorgonomyces haynaldii]